MLAILMPLLLGLGAAAVAMLALYALWLRPALLEARRREEDADLLMRRLESEAKLRLNEAMVQAKEEALRVREKLEDELRQRMATLERTDEKLESEYRKRLQALARQEEKLSVRDDALEERRNSLDEREQNLRDEQRTLGERADSLARREGSIEAELQRVGRLSKDEAREQLIARIEDEFKGIALRKAKEIEEQTLAEVNARVKRVLVDAMQRSVVDYVTSATVAVVELPSEDMKGRIIGRDGRNIRAFEQVTGVDLIVDETPEAVVISCFDPVRRETARLALMNLMLDGRIHPGRIEELYEKAQEEVERTIREAGDRAADRANVHGLPPQVIEMMGRLRFRTSYAQNVLDHSVEVSRLCASLASELGLNIEIAKRAGLLHDIGKALGPEWEGPHAITGMEFLRGFGEKEAVLHAVGAHHHEIEPESGEAMLVIIADTISAARPGARRESLENYIKRLTALEAVANDFPGVERSYALQAGREIRLIVKPDEVDDLGAARLAEAVARKIESEMEYPGQIKVTVIRETRASDVAT